jgi:hypothetical protein
MTEIAMRAPNDADLTDYDRAHLVTYLRLLDAEADGASWEDAARLVLRADPGRGRDVARLQYETHAARARWMSREGYLKLLRPAHG